MIIVLKLGSYLRKHRAESVTRLAKCATPPLDRHAWPAEFNIVLTEIVRANSHSTVYGACFEDEQGIVWKEDNKRVHAVVKMGNLKDIAEEAFRYCCMQSLQGRVIPRMFGFLKAFDGTQDGMGCLLLEHWGQALKIPLYMLEKSEKQVFAMHCHIQA